MGRAADGLVNFAHLRREPDASARALVKTLLDLVQPFVIEDLAPDDVELHGRTAPLRIDVVALAGGGDDAAAVEDALLQPELGGQGIRPVALTQQHARSGMLRVGVAALDHEVLDHTVEEQ